MFDTRGFLNEEFVPRQEAVRVDGLSAFFGEDEEPLWTVRGLTHGELAQAEEASERRQDVAKVVEALEGNDKYKQEAIQELLGVDGKVPKDTAKRMEMLVLGSVEPAEVTLDIAVKLANTFPIEFSALTNKILELTGKGSEAVKKQQASGGSQTSSPASDSAT